MTDVTMANKLCELYAAGQRVALRRYAQADSAVVSTQLSPVVTDLLAGGRALVQELVERVCSPDGAAHIQVERGAMVEGAPETLAVSAEAELARHQQRLLRHTPAGDAREMVSDCGSALRALQRSLQAVEPPVCQLERVPQRLPRQLQVSLTVRRQYRGLWAFHTQLGELSPATARRALRAVGTRIAIAVGSDVFSLLREDDQLSLQELQHGILDWLRQHEEDYAKAVALWRALSQRVEILRQVNLREELVSHDQSVIEQSIAALAARGEEALPEVSRELVSVLGFDDALDEVISTNPSARSLLHELRRALARNPATRAPVVQKSAPAAST
ncbi:MAG TPA: hypothetical protein PKU97_06950 [Kofleriaceae bacterium]|nr:hypothetical protein [Kofleriaceae bacterium]